MASKLVINNLKGVGGSQIAASLLIKIKRLYADGHYSQSQITEMFEDNQGNISRIVTGERWSHIF